MLAKTFLLCTLTCLSTLGMYNEEKNSSSVCFEKQDSILSCTCGKKHGGGELNLLTCTCGKKHGGGLSFLNNEEISEKLLTCDCVRVDSDELLNA